MLHRFPPDQLVAANQTPQIQKRSVVGYMVNLTPVNRRVVGTAKRSGGSRLSAGIFVSLSSDCRVPRLPQNGPPASEEPMPASATIAGFVVVMSVTAMSFRYETFADLITDFALAGVLLGLGSFVALTAMRLVKDRQDHR